MSRFAAAGHEARAYAGAGRFWLVLLAITAIAAGWRCVRLTDVALDYDEVYEVLEATSNLQTLVERHDGFPPLYRLLIGNALEWSGSDDATRWFSMIAGTLGVVAIGLLGREVAGPRAGLFAALLAALSANHVLISQHGRAYALVVLLVTFVLWFGWRARRTGACLDWSGLVAVSWLALATHYYAAIPVTIVGVALLVEQRGARLMKASVAAAALVALGALLLPSLRADMAKTEEFFEKVPFDKEAYAFSYLWLLTGKTLGPSLTELRELGPRAGAIAMAPWGAAIAVPSAMLAVAGWRRLRPSDRVWLVVLMTLPPLLAAAAATVSPTGYNYRYVVWMVVPMLVALGAGADLDPRKPLVSAATVALLVFGGYASWNRWFVDRYAENDYHAVARLIEKQTPEGETPALLAAPTYYGKAMVYAAPKKWTAETLASNPNAENDWDTALAAFAERAGDRWQVWLVTPWYPASHPMHGVASRLVERLGAEEVARVSSTLMVYRAPADRLKPAVP